MLTISERAPHARYVVIAEHIARPGPRRQAAQPFGLVGAHPGWGNPVRPHQRKVEDQVKLIFSVAVISDVVVFPDQHAVAQIGIHQRAQFLHQQVNVGLTELVFKHLVELDHQRLLRFGRTVLAPDPQHVDLREIGLVIWGNPDVQR